MAKKDIRDELLLNYIEISRSIDATLEKVGRGCTAAQFKKMKVKDEADLFVDIWSSTGLLLDTVFSFFDITEKDAGKNDGALYGEVFEIYGKKTSDKECLKELKTKLLAFKK